MPPRDWQVTITGNAPSGQVLYRDPAGELSSYWEFGGGDVVASINVGTAATWERDHRWALDRREEILRRIADEVIRQRAPSCTADFDDRGWIHLRESSPRLRSNVASPPSPSARAARQAQAAASHVAATARKGRLVSYLAIGAIAVATLLWLGRSMFTVKSIGTAFGASKRTHETIVTMVSRLEPYVPSLHRSGDEDRHTLGVLLHVAATGKRRYVELTRNRTSQDASKSRIDVVRGDFAWILAPEPMRVQLSTGKVLTSDEITRDPLAAPPDERRSLAELSGGATLVTAHLAKGGIIGDDRWLGILEPDDIPGSFRAGFRANPAEHFERSKSPRHLHAAKLVADGKDRRFAALQPTAADSLFDGAFVRAGIDAPLLQLAGGALLMLHYTKQYRAGSVIASRVDADGRIVWQHDTEIGAITDILPDPDYPAIIGTRPAVPDKLPETILVVLDARSGSVREHSLWMKE